MNAPPEKPARQSVWQYNLRGLFLATLAVAILSAFAAPLLRAAEPKQRLAFVLIVAETAVGAFLCAAVLIRRRARLEKRFGTLLLSLRQSTISPQMDRSRTGDLAIRDCPFGWPFRRFIWCFSRRTYR